MSELRLAQSTAVSVISQRNQLLLADVGAGKTATVLRAIRARRLVQGRKRVLVVGTKRICNMVWGQEIEIWTPELSYASVAGASPSARAAFMENQFVDIVAINYDNLIWACEHFGDQLPVMFPWLVVDESSKLENPASKSFRAIKPLLEKFEWRLPMTGTPRANHLYDIWGNAYLADLGEALGQYREAFLQRWFWPLRRQIGVDWIPKAGAEEEIYKRLGKTVHRMPFKQKKAVEIDVLLPLNPEVKTIQGLIDASIKLEEKVTYVNGITYARNGHRVNAKLLQLSSGIVYADNADPIWLHNDKLDALGEIVAEANGEPMMVVFQFDHERDAILRRFPQARLLDTDATLLEWNESKVEIMLVHPLSCGHGLNAQFSHSSLQVWYTPTSDAELYTQTIGRLNRPGNPNTVRVVRLIMKGTKDMAAYMVVEARQRGEHATLEMFE